MSTTTRERWISWLGLVSQKQWNCCKTYFNILNSEMRPMRKADVLQVPKIFVKAETPYRQDCFSASPLESMWELVQCIIFLFHHLDFTLPISYKCSTHLTPHIRSRLEGESTESSKTRRICTIPCAAICGHLFRNNKTNAKYRHTYTNLSCETISRRSSCSRTRDLRHFLPGEHSLTRKFRMMQTTIFGGSYRCQDYNC